MSADAKRSAPLEADRLYRFYRAGDEETLALQGVSIRIDAGEMVAVVGPSGSGKSTLLACLSGLDEPSGGTVWITGRRMSHQPEALRSQLRSRYVGVVTQSGNLVDHLSVASNVKLVRALSPRPREHRQSVSQLLDSVGLATRSHAYPPQLSGGEAARAGVAVALAQDPVLLLADEPTGELDGDSERRLLALLRDRADAGGAVLVASHSPAVLRMADRVIPLTDGTIAA